MSGETTTRRTTVSELAKTLAERRSGTTSYVLVKVSAQGALQPEVNITPDTLPEDADRMTAIAIKQVQAIMQAGNGVANHIGPAEAGRRAKMRPVDPEPQPTEDIPL